jgi:hypothetical protein
VALIGGFGLVAMMFFYFSVLVPQERAEDLFQRAEAELSTGAFGDALGLTSEIEPRFAPPGLAVLVSKIRARMKERSKSDAAKIKGFLDEHKLDKAGRLYKITLEEALEEDRQELSKLSAFIDNAKLCELAMEKAQNKEFIDALEAVRGISKDALTEEFQGIEDDLLSLHRADIKDRREEILEIARAGDATKAEARLEALRGASDARVGELIDAIATDAAEIGAALRRRREGDAVIKRYDELMGAKRLGLLYLELARLGAVVTGHPNLGPKFDLLGKQLMNRSRVAIAAAIQLYRAGSQEEAFTQLRRLDVGDGYWVFCQPFVDAKGRRGAANQFSLVVQKRERLEAAVRSYVVQSAGNRAGSNATPKK